MSATASERNEKMPRVTSGVPGVSMRDLLASCAAARAVSTPPPAPPIQQPVRAERRQAA